LIIFIFAPIIWYKLSTKRVFIEYRERFTCGAMGLKRRRRKPQAHSILRTSNLTNLDDYYKGLRRDSRQTFTKIQRIFGSNSITIETVSHDSIGLAHFEVILSHERKVYGLFRACFASFMRFVGLFVMVGTIDHFYIDGKLVAFSHAVIKGNTLRAMWFYQKQEASKCLIWFYAVQKAISRAISTTGVEYVDLGPSYNAQVKEAKQKLNFEEVFAWREMCDYSGSFKVPSDVTCK